MLARKLLFHQGLNTAPVKTPAEDYRLTAAGLWTPAGGDAVSVRSGVIAGAGTSATTPPCQVIAGAGQVTVKPGRVVVQGAAANQGHYMGTIDSDQVRTIAAATIGAGLPTAGQFKAGRVVVRVYDQLYDGGTTDGWDVEVHLGSSAASTGSAALPPTVVNSFTLRTFTVDSSGNVTLTGTVPYTGTAHGVLPVPNGDTTPGVFDGQARRTPAKGLEFWSTTANAWVEGDTGWTDFVVNSPPTVGSDGCNYRLVGRQAFLRMHVAYSSSWTSGFTIATLPAALWPSKKHWFDAMFYGSDARYEIDVNTNGTVTTGRAVPTPTSGFVLAATWAVG